MKPKTPTTIAATDWYMYPEESPTFIAGLNAASSHELRHALAFCRNLRKKARCRRIKSRYNALVGFTVYG